MTDCPICIEPFNGSSRKKVSCPYCQLSYCRECVGTWLTSLSDEPRCPTDTCKKPWTREFMDTIMTKVWRDSTYREYRETLLFDREKALLPATQPRIEAINEAKRIDRELVIPMRERRKTILSQIQQLHAEDAGINTQIWDLTNHADRLREGVGFEETHKKRSAFIRRCPSEGCRGFLSSAWKCGTCELYSCSECQEVKGVARDSPHTCDPANVETAKLIAKDTKACPKCGEMITKIDGCDQMWCVSCHSAFSWRTGQIADGIVHNPHYYEWQRKQNGGEAPRNVGDIPCGGFIDWGVIRRAMCSSREHPGWLALLEFAHRRINHIQQIDMIALNRGVLNVNDNIDLRISYLLKTIDDEEMKGTLQQREKKNEKERELRRVYETLTGAAADIFRRLVQVSEEKGRDLENFKPLINELNELRLFINEALDVLRRRYNCTIRGFNESWERITLKKSIYSKTDDNEIKTVYGLYNDMVEQINNDLTVATIPKEGEDGYVLFKPITLKLKKAQKFEREFPRLTTDTTKLASFLTYFFDNWINVLARSGGIRFDRNSMLYYQRMKDARSESLNKWREHVKELELIVKKIKLENTIE